MFGCPFHPTLLRVLLHRNGGACLEDYQGSGYITPYSIVHECERGIWMAWIILEARPARMMNQYFEPYGPRYHGWGVSQSTKRWAREEQHMLCNQPFPAHTWFKLLF